MSDQQVNGSLRDNAVPLNALLAVPDIVATVDAADAAAAAATAVATAAASTRMRWNEIPLALNGRASLKVESPVAELRLYGGEEGERGESI